MAVHDKTGRHSSEADNAECYKQKDIRAYVINHYTPVHTDESGEVFYSHTHKAYITFNFLKEAYSAEEVEEMFSQDGMNFPAPVEFACFQLFNYKNEK